MDDYNYLLVSYGKIENDATVRAERESTESGFAAGVNGAQTYADARDDGTSGSSALAQGAIVGIAQYLWDEYNNGRERDADKQQALQEAYQDFQNKFSNYQARALNAAAELSEQYSWKPGEAGFDGSQSRPRDPFLLVHTAYNYGIQDQHSSLEMSNAAGQCISPSSPDGHDRKGTASARNTG